MVIERLDNRIIVCFYCYYPNKVKLSSMEIRRKLIKTQNIDFEKSFRRQNRNKEITMTQVRHIGVLYFA